MFSQDAANTVIFDQLILPHHLHRIKHYFNTNDTKVIAVDRDARDMFVLSKYVWPQMGSNILFPSDVSQFISFYKKLRSAEKPFMSENILRIHFEDLIYNYEQAVEKIEDFVGESLGEHSFSQSRFKPELSIKNTQNFRIKPEWEREVVLIEEQMKDMLYDFPFILRPNINETTDP